MTLKGENGSFTLDELQIYTGASIDKLTKLTRAGKLPHSNIFGKGYLYPKKEIDKLILSGVLNATIDQQEANKAFLKSRRAG